VSTTALITLASRFWISVGICKVVWLKYISTYEEQKLIETYTICWPRIMLTPAKGMAIQSCSFLAFFDVERAHCIFLGALRIGCLGLFAPSEISNRLLTSPRKAARGTRMWLHSSRKFSVTYGSKDLHCSVFRCCNVLERVWKKEQASWKSDEAPSESFKATLIWYSNFNAATMSPADQPNDMARCIGVRAQKGHRGCARRV